MKTRNKIIILVTIISVTYASLYYNSYLTASQNWGGSTECEWFGCYAGSPYGTRCEKLFDDIYEDFLRTDGHVSLLDYVHEQTVFIERCANTMQNWAPNSQYRDAISDTFKFQ